MAMGCRHGLMTLVLVTALVILVGCAAGSPADSGSHDSKVLKVAATIFPLADIAHQIGGERVEVVTLLPPGASPHTFEPTPEQMRGLTAARVFISVGPGLDDWAARLGDGGRGDRVDVAVLETIPASALITEQNSGEAHGEDGPEAGSDHDHHGVNPHVWLDPVLVHDHIAPAVARALTEAAPENRDYFAARLRDYQSALEALDESFRTTVGTITDRRFVSVHAAWTYLARRYGLEQVAVVEAFPGKEPSAKWIAGVVDTARVAKASTVLAEPQLNTQTARVIAAELGGRVIILDPLGGPGLPGRDSYLRLMRYNLQALAEGLLR
ncbi:MAG: metal ABC transporter substrate-binding protein [Thermoanaerobacterales bacterium]|nr:metal ABC transporter substrate-binding protein [Thermoanaerobacterales bacterium]